MMLSPLDWTRQSGLVGKVIIRTVLVRNASLKKWKLYSNMELWTRNKKDTWLVAQRRGSLLTVFPFTAFPLSRGNIVIYWWALPLIVHPPWGSELSTVAAHPTGCKWHHWAKMAARMDVILKKQKHLFFPPFFLLESWNASLLLTSESCQQHQTSVAR